MHPVEISALIVRLRHLDLTRATAEELDELHKLADDLRGEVETEWARRDD